MARSPLYVDLDGTLIATDLLHESLVLLVRDRPLAALQLPGWLLRGKAAFKREIARRVRLDPAALPYRAEVLDLIRTARAQGRRVVLATASDRGLAEAVAGHLGLFDAVLASDGSDNLSGAQKLAAIRLDAAGQGFCYAGDAPIDLGVWQGAQAAVVVSNSAALRRAAAGCAAVEAEISVPRASLRDWLYGIRLHQWLKNVLVFLPLLPILDMATSQMLLAALSMFLCFGLAASAIYVLNDLLDLEADRQHPRKCKRPFAAGLIPIAQGLRLALALLAASLVLAALTLPPAALGVLLGYVLLTTLYSTWLKRRVLVDVFTLALLYTLRIIGGWAATQVEPSMWMLGFSMFMFLSLALAKRYVEIGELRAHDQKRIKGRAYTADDGVFVLAAGLSAGQLSILTLSLYLNDPAVSARYTHAYVLWLMCPLLLYWLVRLWLKAYHGGLYDDPVVFALRDRISRLIVLVAVALVWLAL
ncbi:UbiA family prenyltransferase [Rivibacter subsaxonicus]|uniref:4-hydroxybenzoate polyprenyltransferase n=1 Tax=Rivibacter subsaxonicus TaxID=457575 RepID=A0A4Q7W0F6_9BURK|nr:UbiA family prenyltransferase [Rivibacter subsaxonicus]RZU02661.1 4-hydroxybenzoate polyprenyltransferase [Rivibacter subsaxonicus]